ncbi:hypothetical protein [uncultured Pedobacter sp.]|uniref:hypothetical protein n=1 Tax=uncultured Pedobacter sp. TaxID=246139 RepID=UPI0026002C22|nr:hypothetical protein [uncultured Pedobacter sp.]
MRLISCVALLMVIPAIGLLTNSNKFTDKQTPAIPVHKETENDSAAFNWFDRADAVAKFDRMPVVSSTDYRLSFFKPVHPSSTPFFTTNK